MFSYPVYAFNIDGNVKIGSYTGIFCSIIVFTIMWTFSILKTSHLIGGRNPLIANSEITGKYLTPQDTLSLSKFAFAFYVEDYTTNEPKDDLSFIEFYGMIVERADNNTLLHQKIGVHRCNESDYEKFHPPEKDQLHKIEDLKASRTLLCLDEQGVTGNYYNRSLFGKDDIVVHRRLDIMFTPCVPEQLTKENAHL